MITVLEALRDPSFSSVWIDHHADFIANEYANPESSHFPRKVCENGLFLPFYGDTKKRIRQRFFHDAVHEFVLNR